MNSNNSNTENTSKQKNIRVLSVNWNENVIGYLIKELETGNYLYKYDQRGLRESRKQGYTYLVGFKDTRKVYASKSLFPAFKSRIPTRQRRDLGQILSSLGTESYDEFELLALSGGRLLTDSISFKEITPDMNKKRIVKLQSKQLKPKRTLEGEDR